MAPSRFLPSLNPRERRWPRRVGVALIAAAVVLVALGSCIYFQPRFLVGWLVRFVPDVVFRVDTSDPLVALTFDDGPDTDVTPRVLDILRAAHIPATFFLNGERMREHPEVVQAIRAQGHDVGNHLWGHSAELPMRAEDFQRALTDTEALMPPTDPPPLHRPVSFFIRPAEQRICDGLGYRIVLGSAYAGDGQGAPGLYVSSLLAHMAEPGGILILHVGPGHEKTVELLPDLIKEVRAKGLSFVTVHELLKHGRQL